jgi:phosphotransferase system HPr-like phosphotransfer protein
MTFIPNRKFKKEYDRLFKQDPIGANVFLLLAELADDKGQVKIQGSNEKEVAQELSRLMEARFNDPEGYSL